MSEKWKKQFIIVYIGQAFSIVGSSAIHFAIIWWIALQTGSAISLALAAITSVLPSILMGSFAGVWIDRYNRKLVMILADGLVALSSIALALVFLWIEVPPLWMVYSVLFIRGIGSTFHGPAMQATIPMLVPTEMLTKAGGWGNLINSISNMLGPILGGFLIENFSISILMSVDVIGALFAIICLLFVTIPNIEKTTMKSKVLADMKEGFLTIRHNKVMMTVLPISLLCNVIFNPIFTLLPLLVRTHFMGSAQHNSIAEFSLAVGLLISSLVIGVWGGMKKRFLMVSIAIGCLGIAMTIIGVLPTDAFLIFIPCCFLVGAAITFMEIPFMAYVQEVIAAEALGKVISLVFMTSNLARPIGLLLGGFLSETIGVNNWFLLSGILTIGIGIFCRISTKRYDDMEKN